MLTRIRRAIARLRRLAAPLLPERVKRPLRAIEARVRPRAARGARAAIGRVRRSREVLAAKAEARRVARPLDHPATLRFRGELALLALRNRFSRRSVVDPATDVVVTVTTHGKRIERAFTAIESVARGTVRPGRYVLWLDDPAIFHDLPRSIRRLRRRGLEVHLVDNYRVHTKYYPHLLSGRAGERDLVTSDDDIVYPADWLEGILAARSRNPGLVVCYRSHRMIVRDGALAPYPEWGPTTDTEPSFANFGTSVSGQLFPRAFLLSVLERGEAFRAITPDNDDIWLHACAVEDGIRIAQVAPDAQLFPFVPGTQEHGLYLANGWNGGNDRQSAATYTPGMIASIAADLARSPS